ncbi:MAG: hypothetical protein ACOX6L_01575 [Syntrophomonadaceae bacterium]|jgi:hypothetical protein
MIIVISNWKRKLVRIVAVLVVIAVVAAVLPIITGIMYYQIPVLGGVDEEHPSGNPLRVERKQDVEQSMEQFVIHLQDFYYEEKE